MARSDGGVTAYKFLGTTGISNIRHPPTGYCWLRPRIIEMCILDRRRWGRKLAKNIFGRRSSRIVLGTREDAWDVSFSKRNLGKEMRCRPPGSGCVRVRSTL